MNQPTETTQVYEARAGRVRRAVKEALGISLRESQFDVDFADLADGLFDSLAALDLIAAVENEFGIDVDLVYDDVRFWFSRPGRIVDYLDRRRATSLDQVSTKQ